MENIDLFNREYLEHVGAMRELYFRTGSLEGIAGVRSDILACWETSYIANTTPGVQKRNRVSDAEFQTALDRSADVLAVAEPYMKLLHSFLKTDSFWVTFMDNNGVILKLVGSPAALSIAESTHLFEGSYRGVDAPYPGLFYACWQLSEPFQIVSTEHPSSIDDILAGAASPIYEISTGRCLGVIGISGYWWDSHDHTLGLAIMVAEAISQQLALRRKNADIAQINQKLDTALEAVDMGVIYFQQEGPIHAANHRAIELLCSKPMSKEEFLQNSIFSYMNHTLSRELLAEADSSMNKEGLSYELVPEQKYAPLHCTIHKIAGETAEYFLQLQKRTDLNKIVTDTAFSRPLFTFDDIIGDSAALQSVKDTAQIAAKHDPAVLIMGESGTGKELFAQAIHNSSPRANGPFVAINCGAIPKSLIESELFGYEAGAFTGAQKNGHLGKFELANNGTIFLDEIGDMPYEIQVALLRVLQTKEIVRIGGKIPIKVNVRVIAATNQNLEERIAEHTFRQDLYYRLDVFNIRLPALREREGDLIPLCSCFIHKYGRMFDKRISGISNVAIEMMRQYNWPGNIRELENTIERAIIVCSGILLGVKDLPERIRTWKNAPHAAREYAGTEHSPASGWSAPPLPQDMERERLFQTLEANDGNLSAVARQFGVSRPTIYRRLKKYGLYPPQKQYGVQ